MKLSGCDIDERDLIRSAIRNASGAEQIPLQARAFRWALVRDTLVLAPALPARFAAVRFRP